MIFNWFFFNTFIKLKWFCLGSNCTVSDVALVAGERQDVQTVDWNGEDAWFSIKVKLVIAPNAAFATDKRKFVVRKLLGYQIVL